MKAAVIPLAKARQLGLGSPVEDKPVDQGPGGSCAGQSDKASDITQAYQRSWSTTSRMVTHVAFAFEYWDPAKTVEALRSLTPKCDTYEDSGFTVTYVGDYPLSGLTGVEASYGFCVLVGKGEHPPWYLCTAYLVRGNLLTQLSAAELLISKDGLSQRLLSKLVPFAAEALAAA